MSKGKGRNHNDDYYDDDHRNNYVSKKQLAEIEAEETHLHPMIRFILNFNPAFFIVFVLLYVTGAWVPGDDWWDDLFKFVTPMLAIMQWVFVSTIK